MKQASAIPLVLLLQMASAHAVSIPAFTLSIATGSSQVVSGEGVRISILLHNQSSEPVVVPNFYQADEGESHYGLIVRLSDGRFAPKTALARGLTVWACSAQCGPFGVHPNTDFRDEIIVTKLYDLTVPGRYLIQISATWPPLATVTSNQLAITVVPTASALTHAQAREQEAQCPCLQSRGAHLLRSLKHLRGGNAHIPALRRRSARGSPALQSLWSPFREAG